MKNDEYFLKHCFELASNAKSKGNYPFASILVYKDKIIANAQNELGLFHSEISVLSKAHAQFDKEIIEESTLYSSAEPCLMCTGAIILSSIKSVVYGLSEKNVSPYFPPLISIGFKEIIAKSQSNLTIKGPLLEELAIKPFLDNNNDLN